MFLAIPIKIPIGFITEIEKSTLKFIWKHKRPQLTKTILIKKSNADVITTPDIKLYYRATGIKTECWHKNRHEDQRSRIEHPDMNPHMYGHLIFNKGTQNMYWGKDSLLNKWCWEKWISTCRKLKLDPSLSPCISINSKWIKDLNMRAKLLKLFQKKIGNTMNHIGIGKNFKNRTPNS
jgi:hypothetical protein